MWPPATHARVKARSGWVQGRRLSPADVGAGGEPRRAAGCMALSVLPWAVVPLPLPNPAPGPAWPADPTSTVAEPLVWGGSWRMTCLRPHTQALLRRAVTLQLADGNWEYPQRPEPQGTSESGEQARPAAPPSWWDLRQGLGRPEGPVSPGHSVLLILSVTLCSWVCVWRESPCPMPRDCHGVTLRPRSKRAPASLRRLPPSPDPPPQR